MTSSQGPRKQIGDPIFRAFERRPEQAFGAARAAPGAEAIIFLDTNVLLNPYRTSGKTVQAISEVYRKLVDLGRLVVPAQVAREFARNRPSLLGELRRKLTDAKEKIPSPQPLEGIAILVGMPDHIKAKDLLDEVRVASEGARAALGRLIEQVGTWQFQDPLSRHYSDMFTDKVVREMRLDRAAFDKAAKARFEEDIPPGFRDKAKPNGGTGDVEIWFTLLEVCAERGADGILITEDSKDDWFHKFAKDTLFPRYELVEEFAEYTGGRSFAIEPLSWLLKREGASEQAITEVKAQERASGAQGGSRKLRAEARRILGDRMARVCTFMGAQLSPGPAPVDFVADLNGYRIGLAIRELSHPAEIEHEVIPWACAEAEAFGELILAVVTDDAQQAHHLGLDLKRRSMAAANLIVVVCQAVRGDVVVVGCNKLGPFAEPLFLQNF